MNRKNHDALLIVAHGKSRIGSVNYWEIIADNLSKAGWSWGCVSAIDSNGRTIWIADAHRDDGKRFVVRADEKLTAFVELESVIWPANKARHLLGNDLSVKLITSSDVLTHLRPALKKPVGLDLR
jgi:hypothetical protein